MLSQLDDDTRPRFDRDPDDPTAPVDKSHFTAGATLMMNGRIGHPTMAAGRPDETFLFVDVNTEGADVGVTTTAPVNLAIVIDTSGSMEGQRIANATAAARGMIDRLRDGDTVSVVGYSTNTEIMVPATTVSPATRPQIISRIAAISTTGHTCMSCGIEAGMQMLARRTGAVNRMLLLSDGEANRGITDLGGLQGLAADIRQRGASISSIGVDVDYNERVMLALARESNGRHHFVEDASRLQAAFDAELQSLVKTIGKQAQLSVELAPGVNLAQVFDRTFQQVGNRVIVPLGTFTLGDNKTVLMRLSTPSRPAGEQPIARVDLVYDDLVTGRQGSCHGELATIMSDDPTRVSDLDAVVLGRLTKSETAATLQQANDLFARGDNSGARQLIQRQSVTNSDRRKKAKKSKPKGWSGPDPFAGLDKPLEQADAGFANAPASREGRAQVKQNAEDIDQLSL